MKNLLNVVLMAVVVLGVTILEVTNWGYAVIAVPCVVWFRPALDLLHKLPLVAVSIWVLVGFFAWQAALVGFLFYSFLTAPAPAPAPAKINKKKSCMIGKYTYDYRAGDVF